jgi:hypothetical protein
MAYGKNLMARLGIKMAAESITREALVREIEQAYDTIIDDETGSMTFHSSLTVCAPELVVFLGYNQQQLMMDLTDWFDCGHGPEGRWTYRTKTQGSDELIGVWVNLIGATTPDLLRSTLSMDAIGGGLTSRIIFVYAADKGKSCPTPFISPVKAELAEDIYYDLEQIRLMKGEFKYTKEFISLWTDWYTAQEGKEIFKEHSLQPYCERRPVHIMKLSMVMSACRNSKMIVNEADLSKAITLLEHTERFMPRVFSGIGKSPHAEVISKIMTEIGLQGKVAKSTLMAKFYNDADDRALNLMIETLKTMKFLNVIYDAMGNEILVHCKTGPGGQNESFS